MWIDAWLLLQADSLQSSRSLGRSSRVSSGSIERQLPVCPEGVSIQQDNTVWEPVENSSEQPSHGASSLDGNASHGNASTSYETDSSSNAYSSCTATREGALEQSVGIKAANEALHSSAQLSAIITEGSRSVQMGGSSDSTEQRLPAWDDLDTQNTEVNPSVAQPKSIAPAGFALFDSASSDPGTYSGAAPRGDGFKGEQAPCLTVISSESKQKRIQCIRQQACFSAQTAILQFQLSWLRKLSTSGGQRRCCWTGSMTRQKSRTPLTRPLVPCLPNLVRRPAAQRHHAPEPRPGAPGQLKLSSSLRAPAAAIGPSFPAHLDCMCLSMWQHPIMCNCLCPCFLAGCLEVLFLFSLHILGSRHRVIPDMKTQQAQRGQRAVL